MPERPKWCKPTVKRHAPLHKPNLNKRQRNAIKHSDVSQSTTNGTQFWSRLHGVVHGHLFEIEFQRNFDGQFSISSMEIF